MNRLENYEELMPDNNEKFELENGEGFNFQLKGLPKVGMKFKQKTEPHEIVFESPSENFSYDFTINIEKVEENISDVWIDFDGKFNPMIEMMAKAPLQKFINAMVEKLENKFALN